MASLPVSTSNISVLRQDTRARNLQPYRSYLGGLRFSYRESRTQLYCRNFRNLKVHSVAQSGRTDDEKGKGKEGKEEKEMKGKWDLAASVEGLIQVASAIAALIVSVVSVRGIDSVQKTVPGVTKKKKKQKQRSMTAEERQEWTSGLPPIEEQIPCKDVFDLKQKGKIKYIIRHPESKLREAASEVFVVMSDDRVVRTLVPMEQQDSEFWKEWDDLKLSEEVNEAYTPPPPLVEIPEWATKGPSLRFLRSLVQNMKMTGNSKKNLKKNKREREREKPKESPYGIFQSAARARVEELERIKAERERIRMLKEARVKQEEAFRARERKRVEETQRRKQLTEREAQQLEAKREKILLEMERRERQNIFWSNAANSEGVRFTLGVFFFWLFYVTIVMGIKKRRQDYEDRIKIQKAEDAERQSMNKLESNIASGKVSEEEENDQLKLGLRFMRSGAKMRRGHHSRVGGDGSDVKFSDVAGLGDIRRELEEVVEFFTHAERYRRRGCKIPSGILLCGDPGVGKTLLAKAVAGEAGVNFFAISASQFVEIYVGVGASRVRSLYAEAKENAPAVVFIDELDAVGRERGLSSGSGAQERDATLNQLLTCLDGFEGKGDVITIAATNRPDILDPALVRPGRFDRKIHIPKPSLQGRVEILQVHTKNKPMAENIDYHVVSQMTANMVGAQLAHVVDVAALAALRDGRTEITTDDLLEAAHYEEGGRPEPRRPSERVNRILALHEASMAAMAINCPDTTEIQLISIVPRMGENKGFIRFRADPIKFGPLQSISRQAILDHITIQVAPRAADELWNGADQLCTVWADNVDDARKTARILVRGGLSDNPKLYGSYVLEYTDDAIQEIDIEAFKILNSCYERAKQFLIQNKELVNALVDRLMLKKTIRAAEFNEIVEQFAVPEKPNLQPMEYRNLRRKEFEEQMMNSKKKKKKQLTSTITSP